MSEARKRHGAAAKGKCTKEYRAWMQIHRRCVTGSIKSFKDYGAKGVLMAPEWIDDFSAFLSHIGPAPSEKHTVDRIKNDRGYEPGNVRWATRQEQARNTRRNIYVDFNGEKTLLIEVCEMTGLNYHTARKRVWRGMPFNG